MGDDELLAHMRQLRLWNQNDGHQKYAEPWMFLFLPRLHRRILPGCVKECRISTSVHPIEFHVVPLELEKPYLPLLKQFRKKYAGMDENQIKEVTPTPSMLKTENMVVAVCHKSRWYRGSVCHQVEESIYMVYFMDVGNFEKIHISKIRLLILEYLFIPALAVRCSFLNQINVGRVSKKQAEYFEDVTRGNPICEVTFVRLFLIEGGTYWEPKVNIKKQSALHEEERENPRAILEKVNLCFSMQRAMQGPDSELHHHYF